MEIKQNLKYLESHEWADVSGNKVKVGITDFAQNELGDIVFVELPSVGEKVVKRLDEFLLGRSCRYLNAVFVCNRLQISF